MKGEERSKNCIREEGKTGWEERSEHKEEEIRRKGRNKKRHNQRERVESKGEGEAKALYSFNSNLWHYKKGHFLKNLYRKV